MIFDAITVVLTANASMASDFTTDTFECGGYDRGGMVCFWTGAATTDAVLRPQFTIDDVHWCNFVAQSNALKVNAVNGDQMYEFTSFCFPHIRLQYLAKTNTTGSLTVKFWARRQAD